MATTDPPHAATSSEPLLIHSLSTYREIILGALETVAPKRLVEVGSEFGGFTSELADWLGERDAEHVVIEPYPVDGVVELDRERDHVTLVRDRTPAALEGLAAADAYVLDGDHNYWTMLGELRRISASTAGRPWLAVMHDVGWPWARRDLYYAPDLLPEEAKHPHTFTEGVVPGDPGTVPGTGFRGGGQFAAAREEGGERNGVLTAVEDHMAEHEELAFLRVPAVFGVGFLYTRGAPWAAELERVVGPFHEHPLLHRLERNRIDLYLAVVGTQDARSRAAYAQEATISRLRARVAELEARLIDAPVDAVDER